MLCRFTYRAHDICVAKMYRCSVGLQLSLGNGKIYFAGMLMPAFVNGFILNFTNLVSTHANT